MESLTRLRQDLPKRAGPFVIPSIVCTLWILLPTPAFAPCGLPDLPSCACYVADCDPADVAWPPPYNDLIVTARRTVGLRTCCFQHGGQAYWQVQRQASIPASAEALAFENPTIETDEETAPAAWCTETIAYWAKRATVPYAGGYYTNRHHPSSYIEGGAEMREWYLDEEAFGGLYRGRWIDATELDYDNFEPGVNGPCPGAYQQIYSFDRTDPDGNGNYWDDETTHSQLIDSMVVYRSFSEDGPVQRIDVHMVEGNVGFGGGSVYSRVINTRWYNDIIDFTPLGPDDEVLDSSNRKIRGWGINLTSDQEVDCDDGRIRTVVWAVVSGHPGPIGPENSDAAHVTAMLGYYAQTGGNILVTSNSPLVQTGGALPTETNPWFIPPGPHPVEPVYIDIDLLATHPVPVEAVTFEWLDAIPRQFQVLWSAQGGAIQTRPVVLPSPPPIVPNGTPLPLPIALNPAGSNTGHPIRYLRLCISNSQLTRPFLITALHYNFHHTDIEDHNGSSEEGDAGPPSGIGGPASTPDLRIAQPVPNPFSVSARVAFHVPEPGAVSLVVYDVQGRSVRVLVRSSQPAGDHEATWDGKDEGGRQVPSGVYFLRLEQGGAIVARKIVLTR